MEGHSILPQSQEPNRGFQIMQLREKTSDDKRGQLGSVAFGSLSRLEKTHGRAFPTLGGTYSNQGLCKSFRAGGSVSPKAGSLLLVI